MISLIIPVYNESENLPDLLEKLASLEISSSLELVIVDDSYDDLTLKSTESFNSRLNIKYLHRRKRLGLASAVIDGFNEASSGILVCMDGDGSHPPQKIDELAAMIREGHSMVMASRNVPGGGADSEWSSVRKFISMVCNLLVRPLTGLKDPMSGFFAVSKDFFESVKPRLKPISYKIALELAVKGRLKRVPEIPFKFEERKAGSSKVNFSVIGGMIYHFISLYCWRIFARKV